ncbi:MAG: hypothetical protein FJ006_13305 [Chloroflexi bacterium]|nr:hypothetical protein [Chloroflexota bacterium]
MPDFSDPQWLDFIKRIKAWLSEPFWNGVIGVTAILLVIVGILALPRRIHSLIKRFVFGAFVGAAPYLVIAVLQLRQSIVTGQPTIPSLTIRQALIAMIIPSVFFAFVNRLGVLIYFLPLLILIGVRLVWSFLKLNPDSPTFDAIENGCMSGFFLGGIVWVIWMIKTGGRPFLEEIKAEDNDS